MNTMCLVMKPLQSPPLWQYGALYTLFFFSLQLLQYYAHFSNNGNNNLSTFMEMLCVLAKAGQRAECQAALPHRQLPSEVRMSNAARPLHRISQHHGGKIQRRCWEGGRWGKQHIVSHTSMQMPSLRWDRNFCPCTDKNRLNYLQRFPHCSTTYKGFDLILFYKLKTPWPQLPDLDKTCINVLQTADYDPLISGTYASVQSDRGWITSSE